MKRQSFALLAILAALGYVDAIGVETASMQRGSRRRRDRDEEEEEEEVTPTPDPEPEEEVVEFEVNYFNRPTYQALTREEKLDDLWTAIRQETGPIDNYWSEWGTLFSTDFEESMRNGDEMRDGRLKLAHT